MVATTQQALRYAPGKAVFYMLSAVTGLFAMDAGIKWLTSNYSVPLLNEKVGPCRRAAVFLGFLGVLVGLAGSFGQFFLNQAFRYGEVSLLAPLDYTGMIWGILFGFALWGELPSTSILVGAAIIAACSIYIVRREAQRRRNLEIVATPRD
ncbi:MAG: EamA family transporter [Dongiaceae bacterium]